MNSEECIKTRRSIRHFNTNTISIEVIKDLIESASYAPAPHHTKPWRFVIVDKEPVSYTHLTLPTNREV